MRYRTPTPDSWTATNIRLWREFRAGRLPKELLLVGPAGTGKTWGAVDFFHVLCRDNPDLRVLWARATRAALTESVLVTYEQRVLPNDGMEWLAAGVQRRVRQTYRYPNGSEIVLAGLDNPVKALSTEWDFAYINECIEVQPESWETLLSRMKRPGRKARFGYLIGDTNPGDPTHWLRGRVESGKLAEWTVPHEANPANFDGRSWTPEGLAYLEHLEHTLTGSRYKRLREGLWTAGEGAWFGAFDSSKQVGDDAEFDPRFPVHLACDSNGFHNAAVWFQLKGSPEDPVLHVFGDWYSEAEIGAYAKAAEILRLCGVLCRGGYDFGTYDPAAGSNMGFDTTISAEYTRAGLKRLQPWPNFPGSVLSGLNLIESFLPSMRVHPRCERLIAALAGYMRQRRPNGQWIDKPVDPQHPHEDLIDSLRGGLLAKFPEGRKPAPKLATVKARRVF